MKKNLLTLALVASSLLTSHMGFAGGNSNEPKPEDIKYYKLECKPGLTQCEKTTVILVPPPKSVNAVGDKESYNVAGVSIDDLGTISETKSVELVMPANGNKKIYSFNPTTGHRDVAGKSVKILLIAYNLDEAFPAGTPEKVVAEGKAGKAESDNRSSMLKVYTQKGAESQWTEIATYFAPDKDLSKLDALKVNIEPNGNVTVPQLFGRPFKAFLGKII